MNIGMRLAATLVLSTLSHYPVAAASICFDRSAAIEIANLHQEAIGLELNGHEQTAALYQQRAAELAKAHCGWVDRYPPQLTKDAMKSGCTVSSGEFRAEGKVQTVYWTQCPKPLE